MQNITSSPLTLRFVSLSPSATDSTVVAAVFHKATDGRVNNDPAADVGAAVGTLVSLPKQLCPQRWVDSPAMMDHSDKFCHAPQPTQLLDSGISQQGWYIKSNNRCVLVGLRLKWSRLQMTD